MIAYIRGTRLILSQRRVWQCWRPVESATGFSCPDGIWIFYRGRRGARLYTYLQVREDAFVLFGFFTREDRKLFQQLLSVQWYRSEGGPWSAFRPFRGRSPLRGAGG